MGDQVDVDPRQVVLIAHGLAGAAVELHLALGMLGSANNNIRDGGPRAQAAAGATVADAQRTIASAAKELEGLDTELRRRAILLEQSQRDQQGWQALQELLARAEVYAPGLAIELLKSWDQFMDGNAVRTIDQELAISERLLAGQSIDQAVRETLGLDGGGGASGAALGRAAADGQPTVFFVGGIKTNDSADPNDATATHTWQNHERDLSSREDLQGVGYATFNWGSAQGLDDSLAFPSTTVPVTNATDDVEQQLRALSRNGASNIVLAGHSKGGALVMEYLCEVAEGTRPMLRDADGKPLVVAASAMDSPLGGGPSSFFDPAVAPDTDPFLADFVGFQRYQDGQDRIKNAAEKLKGQVDIRIYDNPDDVVSSPGPNGTTHTQPYPVDLEHPLDIQTVHGEVLRDDATRANFWEFVEHHGTPRQ